MDDTTIRNKLKYRSRRSILEVDLYLDKFVTSQEFLRLDLLMLGAYQELLHLDDDILLSLIHGKYIIEISEITKQVLSIIVNCSKR